MHDPVLRVSEMKTTSDPFEDVNDNDATSTAGAFSSTVYTVHVSRNRTESEEKPLSTLLVLYVSRL